MLKHFRFLTLCTISIDFASIASAQTYTSVDIPDALVTIANGGPNPRVLGA